MKAVESPAPLHQLHQLRPTVRQQLGAVRTQVDIDFESNLAPDGRILLADPFRKASFELLDVLEGDGWRISLAKWNVGEERRPRPMGVYELAPPGAA